MNEHESHENVDGRLIFKQIVFTHYKNDRDYNVIHEPPQ